MKANEFIKEYGLEEAREHLEKCDGLDHVYMGDGFYIDDLKCLIESHDLLDEIDGVDGARDRIYFCEIDGCTSFSLGGYVYEVSQVKQAIADVESCL